jgi:hypothetical protein
MDNLKVEIIDFIIAEGLGQNLSRTELERLTKAQLIDIIDVP